MMRFAQGPLQMIFLINDDSDEHVESGQLFQDLRYCKNEWHKQGP